MQCYVSAVYAVVCPSVRPSVTRQYYTKKTKGRITKTTPNDSPETLKSKISTKFQQGHSKWGRHIEVEYVKSDNFRPISHYISELYLKTEM